MATPRLVVDGYNLIHASPVLAGLVATDLEQARDTLVAKLAVYRSQRNVRVTVVFDGRGPDSPRVRAPGGVEVLFSRAPQNADAKIKAMLSLERNPRSWTIVTSDHSIVLFARDYGAKTIGAAEFAARLGSGIPNLGPSRPRPKEASLTPAEVADWEEFFRRGKEGVPGFRGSGVADGQERS